MVKDSNQQILYHSRGLNSPLTNPALAYYRLVRFPDHNGSGNLVAFMEMAVCVKHYLHPLLLNILIRSIR